MKLGDTARDRITGLTGIVVARTEWLNGCVRVTIQPRTLHDGKPIDNQTFDIEQLELVETDSLKPKARAVGTGGERQNIGARKDVR